jgi:hypothetical protein
MKRAAIDNSERPTIQPRDAVVVTDEVGDLGTREWSGVVLSVKPSPASGWWFDIRRDDDGGWYVRHESTVRAIETS